MLFPLNRLDARLSSKQQHSGQLEYSCSNGRALSQTSLLCTAAQDCSTGLCHLSSCTPVPIGAPSAWSYPGHWPLHGMSSQNASTCRTRLVFTLPSLCLFTTNTQQPGQSPIHNKGPALCLPNVPLTSKKSPMPAGSRCSQHLDLQSLLITTSALEDPENKTCLRLQGCTINMLESTTTSSRALKHPRPCKHAAQCCTLHSCTSSTTLPSHATCLLLLLNQCLPPTAIYPTSLNMQPSTHPLQPYWSR